MTITKEIAEKIKKIGGHLHGKKSTAKQPDQSYPS